MSKYNSNKGGSGGSGVSTSASAGVPRARIPHATDDDKFANSLSTLKSSLGNVKNTQSYEYGDCPVCRKPVIGDQIKAFNKVYHPEHFQCSKCKAIIRSTDFYEINSNPLCDKCYQHGGSVICASCKTPIIGKVTTAMGKSYHPGHFQCCVCKTPLDTIPFMEEKGKIYCEKDYQANFGSCCVDCRQPIEGECIQEDNRYWHPEHFKCGFCHQLIESGNYFFVDGKLCCEADYANEAAPKCGKCGFGITGDFLDAMDQKWHINHFVCHYCSKSLATIDYTNDNGKPFCLDCAQTIL